MTTEDLLKVKYVLVCALVSTVKEGKAVGIPVDQLVSAIGIINRKIGFRDDNSLEDINQATTVKSLLKSCKLSEQFGKN